MARNTRPFLSTSIWNILTEFMNFMRNLPGEEGKNYKIVYENFTQSDLVKRLLFKRPVVFCEPILSCMRFDEGPIRGNYNFYDVATSLDSDEPKGKPWLREYISYDEILLSSLICMSTPTFYVSDGSIRNWNKISTSPHIERGILCGLVGATNTKINFLENRFIYPLQPNHSNEVHKSDEFWIKYVYREAFPEGKIPTQDEVNQFPEIYGKIYSGDINMVYFEKRLMFSIIPFIEEASARGVEIGKNVFCSVPPIGAGVWAGQIDSDIIRRLIIEGVIKYLDDNFDYAKFNRLAALVLPKTDLSFYSSLRPSKKVREIKINDDATVSIFFYAPKDHKITIFNQVRYVAELLPKGFENCLSIAGYAWDGNSYPGNEYWKAYLCSFDPQAIYCSLLGQFQNPEVNTKIADAERIKVY